MKWRLSISKVIGIVFIALISLPVNADAHQLPPKEINRIADIRISRNMVTIDYTLSYYGVAEIEELLKMDKDRDGRITSDEKLNYFKERVVDLEKTLYIIINDRMLMPSLIERISFSGQPFTEKFKFGIRIDGITDRDNRLLFYDRKYGPLCKKNEVSVNYSDNVNVQKITNLDKGFEVRFGASGSGIEDRMFSALDIGSDIVKDIEGVEISPKLAYVSAGKVGRFYERLRLVLSDVFNNPGMSTRMKLMGIVIAFILGGLHALTPGHGKTLTSVYIVGSHGTKWQVALLGLIVALTHTLSVILLGVIALFASKYFMPEKIYPWIGFVSGILIYIVGFWLFIRKRQEHEHTHIKGMDRSLWSVVTVGIIAGAVPCPDALVILLIGVVINKILFGILILLAFGFGVAVVLVGIGMLIVEAGLAANGFFVKNETLLHILPRISAVIIMLLGIIIAIRSLASAGILWLNI
jgi:ABC-type nickel/cobalt efflux system permease component RcnA